MNYSQRELDLIANTDVLGHIRACRAEMDARGQAEGWLFWMGPCESLATEYANVYEYLRCSAMADYSDGYKELNGIRPRWVRTDLMTLEMIEELLEMLHDDADARRAFELEYEEIAEKEMQAAQEEASWHASTGMEFLLQDELSGLRRRG